jgi:RNA polymerase sigma factor (sigma-70 family)
MPNKHLTFILRHLRHTIAVRETGQGSDGQLLQRFVQHGDEEAFETLVKRHGPLVLAVCNRVVNDPNDAADVFQATFLVLARKANSIRRQESVGRWLYEVAYRLGLKAKITALRRRNHETRAAELPKPEPQGDLDWRELRLVLDQELHRLPEKYRGPLILCYLEGKTNEEAARELGWPVGSMSGRLAQARDRLRSQLAGRGVVLSTGLLVPVLADRASAAVPAALIANTVQAVIQFASTSAKSGAFTAPAAVLAEEMLHGLFLRKVRVATAAVLALAAVGVGCAWLMQQNVPAPASAATAVLTEAPEDSVARLVLWNADGRTPAVNQAGGGFPTYLDARQGPRQEGGVFAGSIDPGDKLTGRSLRMRLTEGHFYAQFNPYAKDGGRGFAREYVAEPQKWRFNTYNRMRLQIQLPVDVSWTNGKPNFGVGAFVKRVQGADAHSDEAGGGHYHHFFTVPAAGAWVQLIVNMHPHHGRIDRANDPGNLAHPTGEPEYNYFDALTRFFVTDTVEHTRYPADYLLDQVEFYRERFPENDDQIMSLAGTYLAESNRLIVTWSRPRGTGEVVQEIRYAYQNIHEIGWSAAQRAPGGSVTLAAEAPRSQPLVYDSAELPLAGRSIVYLAIKPRDSELFSQIAIPLRKR